MRKPRRAPMVAAVGALTMSMIAFIVGSAPFTPTIGLAVIALPIAIVCLFLGVWRISLISIYWAASAYLSIPLAQAIHARAEYTLVGLGVGGLALSALFYFSYARIKNVA